MPNSTLPDLLLYNGHFITMDPSLPNAKALAIKEGRIAWIGETPSEPHAKQILDLKGAYVYPGFIDTHMHLLFAGLVGDYVQLQECPDRESVLVKVEERALLSKPGEWVIGVGWDDHYWPVKGGLTAIELDKRAPQNPVMMLRKDSHLMCVNSLALKIAKIDSATPDPLGGIIARDAQGAPNGILIDAASVEIRNAIPLPILCDKVAILQRTLQQCLSRGLTSIHNAATNKNDFEAFHYMAIHGLLPIRLYAMATVGNSGENPFFSQGPQDYGPFLQMRCLKLWMDGAMGSRGAALVEPYSDDPVNRGLLLWEEKELLEVLQKAKAQGFQVAIHAIGDRASHDVLNAYQKIGVTGLRWRIEHAQQLLPEDITRFTQLGVIASMQPLHYTVDKPWLEHRLGRDRVLQGAFVWKSLLESGAHVCGGSDAPVVDFNPLLGMHAAITREGSQKLTPFEALKMYTQDAAYACFADNELGSLAEQKLADLVILPENILTCPPENLLDMPVLYTIVKGEIVYSTS